MLPSPDRFWQTIGDLPGGRSIERLSAVVPPRCAYVAGGVLRDIMIEARVPEADIDVFCHDAVLDDVLRELERDGQMTIGPFGSRRIVLDDGYVDVIVIESFYNGLWWCRNIVDVLNQFDMTINALAIDLCSGECTDALNAELDVEARVIRAVRFDYPDEPISDSLAITRPAVLWLRLYKYAHQLDFRIEPITLRWMRDTISSATPFAADFQRLFGGLPATDDLTLPL